MPVCGKSDQRNIQYLKNYNPRKFFRILGGGKNSIIFDVGAHRGESVNFYKRIFPYSKIFSFEPESENFYELTKVCIEKNKSGKGSAQCFNFAIAEKTGYQSFYRQKMNHLGGLLPVHKASKDSIGYAKRALNKPMMVKTTSIDLFCQEKKIQHIDILKIDVQGCEAKVLSGAQAMLKKCKICVLEISFFDFYGTATSIVEIEKFLAPAGFRLWDISKISKNPKNLRTDWAEFVYHKR